LIPDILEKIKPTKIIHLLWEGEGAGASIFTKLYQHPPPLTPNI